MRGRGREKNKLIGHSYSGGNRLDLYLTNQRPSRGVSSGDRQNLSLPALSPSRNSSSAIFFLFTIFILHRLEIVNIQISHPTPKKNFGLFSFIYCKMVIDRLKLMSIMNREIHMTFLTLLSKLFQRLRWPVRCPKNRYTH